MALQQTLSSCQFTPFTKVMHYKHAQSKVGLIGTNPVREITDLSTIFVLLCVSIKPETGCSPDQRGTAVLMIDQIKNNNNLDGRGHFEYPGVDWRIVTNFRLLSNQINVNTS